MGVRRCNRREVLHQEVIEFLAQILVFVVLRKVTKEKSSQHRLFAKMLALQHLADLRHLNLTIDIRKPLLNPPQYFVLWAVNRIFQVLRMRYIELKLPNQGGVKRI